MVRRVYALGLPSRPARSESRKPADRRRIPAAGGRKSIGLALWRTHGPEAIVCGTSAWSHRHWRPHPAPCETPGCARARKTAATHEIQTRVLLCPPLLRGGSRRTRRETYALEIHPKKKASGVVARFPCPDPGILRRVRRPKMRKHGAGTTVRSCAALYELRTVLAARKCPL